MFVLSWPSTNRHGDCQEVDEVWVTHSVRLHWRKPMFFFACRCHYRWFLSQSEMEDGVCFPHRGWDLSGLGLYRPCTYCHSLWEFKCRPSLLCLKDTDSFVSSIPAAFTVFTPLLLHSSLSPERRGLMETPHLGLSVPKRKSKIFFIKSRHLFPHSSGGCGAGMKAPAGSGTGEGYSPRLRYHLQMRWTLSSHSR